MIKQEWLRRAVKSYLSYSLPLYSASTCRTRVQSITCFSNFLATERPRVTGRSITRRLLLEYLSYLQGRQSVAVRKNHVLNLRNFLEMSHRERWLRNRARTHDLRRRGASSAEASASLSARDESWINSMNILAI